jgi:beta-xylosidase
VIPGWYADPEAHVFEGRYWLYPTYSAKYEEQVHLDAFSSTDLVTWTRHERIVDTAAVKWANKAMWAPSIVQKDGWYYLFFGANDIQNDQEKGGIGVARSRSPEGPFTDYLGKPLVDRFHNGAQPIDQMVFRDDDGSYYIVYGGWRHCNIAAQRRLHRLRTLRRWQHLQGDHAQGLRGGRVHAAQGRQVLLHVVGGRLDRPQLRRGVRGG